MSNLRALPPPAPNERVIQRLENALELARKGQLRGFILAGSVDDPGVPGSTVVMRAGTAPIAPLVVALERAKLRLIGFVEDIDIDLELAGTDP